MRSHGYLPGEDLLRRIASDLAFLSEAIAVVIIAVAVAAAAWRTLLGPVIGRGSHLWGDLRLDLGRRLILALEFLLAADIVRTAVAPTWEDIGKLAAIAVIRTGLNVFLQRDVQEAKASRDREQPKEPPSR